MFVVHCLGFITSNRALEAIELENGYSLPENPISRALEAESTSVYGMLDAPQNKIKITSTESPLNRQYFWYFTFLALALNANAWCV